jgi:hypothetical protein
MDNTRNGEWSMTLEQAKAVEKAFLDGEEFLCWGWTHRKYLSASQGYAVTTNKYRYRSGEVKGVAIVTRETESY